MIIFFVLGFIYALLISTGMGGGILIAPYLIQYCDFDISQARTAMLLLYVPASVILTYRNIKNGTLCLNMRAFTLMAISRMVGVIIGKFFFDGIDISSMKRAYAVFIILVGLLQIGQLIFKRKKQQ